MWLKLWGSQFHDAIGCRGLFQVVSFWIECSISLVPWELLRVQGFLFDLCSLVFGMTFFVMVLGAILKPSSCGLGSLLKPHVVAFYDYGLFMYTPIFLFQRKLKGAFLKLLVFLSMGSSICCPYILKNYASFSLVSVSAPLGFLGSVY